MTQVIRQDKEKDLLDYKYLVVNKNYVKFISEILRFKKGTHFGSNTFSVSL